MKKQKVIISAGLILTSFLAACESTEPAVQIDNEVACTDGSFHDADFSPIVGGKRVVEGSWVARKTVFLLSTAGDGSACTATLIDQDVILTAAHCVDTALKEPEKLIAVFSARPQCDADNKSIVSKMVQAKEIRMHEGYDAEGSSLGGADLALVKLAKPAPATAEIVELKDSDTPWTSYDRVLIAGYGRTLGGSAEETKPLSLRAVVRQPLIGESLKTVREGVRNHVLKEMSDSFATMWLDWIFESGTDSEKVWLDQTDRRGACSGDSGGPAFVFENGKIKQLGVASSVLTGANPEDTCLIASSYTNVLKYKTWISENYQTLTGRDASRLFSK